ncbi:MULTISPECIES: Ppx/GppA phosphatase family protein [unclassified Salinibacterium]|uniref:Ppx/GppA phosphatase family protein n=1 Tax=unclassified Salinibacterium TaxID=2632331 RepID=UPI00141E6F11|nr:MULTISPECIES: Ppx/GppA phosphatase family protein [unclassified Salinibacterium]
MRLGVLDVGSNTVHLLIVDAHPGARPVPTASQKWVLRLMRHLTPEGAITEQGVQALLSSVAAAAEQAKAADVDEFLPMATSAIREALNGPEVLDRVARETGVTLRVLSGEDEARLTFLAVRRWYGWSSGHILLFDIGGGSLEITSGSDEIPDVALSLPLGAGRSTVGFLRDDPPQPEQVDALRAHARAVIRDVLPQFRGQPDADHMIGSSKTIRSLARLAGSTVRGFGAEDRSILRLKELSDWVPRLARIPADSRPALPGVTEDRAFQIVAGAVVLEEAMRAFKVDSIEVSPWAMREGVMLRYLDQLESV